MFVLRLAVGRPLRALLMFLFALMCFRGSASAAVGDKSSVSVDAGARLAAQYGCAGCHGATFGGGVGPKLVGIEHRRSAAQIFTAIERPKPPMPNFGLKSSQIGEIVAFLSSLDGGSAGSSPIIIFKPSASSSSTMVSVRFPGTPPRGATLQGVMHMGMTMRTQRVALRATSDPHVLAGTLHFSMDGPWTVMVHYGATTLSRPIVVGGGQ